MSIPIVRLEVDRMRHSIYTALTEYQVQMDEQVRLAVAKACEPANIQRVLADAVSDALNAAIEEETRSFFAYGEGRELVKKAVLAKLQSELVSDASREATREDAP